MKKLLSSLALMIILVSCDPNAEETHNPSETRRLVRAAWGVNQNIKVIRWVDTMYHVGDTIRLDMSGVSSIHEAIIIR